MPQDTTTVSPVDPSEDDASAVPGPIEHVAKDSVFQSSVRIDSSGRVLHEWEVDPPQL